jgi:hypothetical protein
MLLRIHKGPLGPRLTFSRTFLPSSIQLDLSFTTHPPDMAIQQITPPLESMSPSDASVRKRVCKACDRCRLKKSKVGSLAAPRGPPLLN